MKGVTVSPIADMTGDFWMTLFHGCHSISSQGIVMHAWPDGECLLEQEEFIVDAFRIFREEALTIMAEQRKTRGRK